MVYFVCSVVTVFMETIGKQYRLFSDPNFPKKKINFLTILGQTLWPNNIVVAHNGLVEKDGTTF